MAALPDDNLMKYCYDNITSTMTTYNSIVSEINNAYWEYVADYVEEMFDYPYAITFNCFYTIFGEDILTQFPLADIMLNVAFNAGYMYNDVKDIVVYF